jgi:opacity protein-like surface antigen
MTISRYRKIFCSLAVVVLLLAAPAGAAAFDGEVGDAGDTTSVTDVFISGQRATVDTQYLRDCPTYINDCWIELRFASRCPEIWCGWNYQSWRRVNASGTAQADCTGSSNNDNLWAVQYRVGFASNATKTVWFYGENEGYWNLGGSFVYRLIAEVMFNYTNQTGTKYGTYISSVTSTFAYSPSVEVATSGGSVLITC